MVKYERNTLLRLVNSYLDKMMKYHLNISKILRSARIVKSKNVSSKKWKDGCYYDANYTLIDFCCF